MNRIRVGVFGAGVLGGFHIDKCLRNSVVDFRGFYDVNPGRRREVEGTRKVPAFADADELIGCIDAAIVATPCSTHRAVAQRCLEAGCHVLVEKPLAESYESGRHLVESAAGRNLVLHVGHSEFYNPAFQQLLSCAPQPRFMEIHRLAAFSSRGTDVAVILDLMIHDLHLAMRLCREQPDLTAIAATGVAVISEGIDIANVRLSFPSGCVANLTASRISLKKMRKLRLFQRDEYFSVDLESREFVHCRLDPGATRQPFGVDVNRSIAAAQDALESELDVFLKVISGEAAGGVTGAEGLDVLRISDAILDRL